MAGVEHRSARDGCHALLLGMPIVPEGIAFTHHSPRSDLGRQIVVRFDDARDLVIVEG